MRISRATITILVNVSLIGLQFASAQSYQPAKVKVHGNFKKCTQYFYGYKDGVIDSSTKRKKYVTIFNKKGKMVSETNYHESGAYSTYQYGKDVSVIDYVQYNSDGTIYLNEIYEYKDDKKHQLFEHISFEVSKSGEQKLKDRKAYKYDYKKRIVEEIFYCSNLSDVYNRVKTRYNAHGKEIEIARYDSKDSMESKVIFKYDKNGNHVEAMFYNSEGYNRKSTFKYNEKNKLLEAIEYNHQDSIEHKLTYKYDDQGNQVEGISYNKDLAVNSKTTSKYDSEGNWIESLEYHSDGKVHKKFTTQYDIKNRKIEWYRTSYYPNEIQIPQNPKKTWKYDLYGNILEEVEYDSTGIPQSKIEYVYSK